jgi:hypothetical protein
LGTKKKKKKKKKKTIVTNKIVWANPIQIAHMGIIQLQPSEQYTNEIIGHDTIAKCIKYD